VIIIGVSGTVFVIFMVLGGLAWFSDGVQRVRKRQQRKATADAIFESSRQPNGDPRI
jgi:hypothetical protein